MPNAGGLIYTLLVVILIIVLISLVLGFVH